MLQIIMIALAILFGGCSLNDSDENTHPTTPAITPGTYEYTAQVTVEGEPGQFKQVSTLGPGGGLTGGLLFRDTVFCEFSGEWEQAKDSLFFYSFSTRCLADTLMNWGAWSDPEDVWFPTRNITSGAYEVFVNRPPSILAMLKGLENGWGRFTRTSNL